MEHKFFTLKDLDLQNKTILIRADLNVPTKDGKVQDTTRIEKLLPTIEYLNNKNCKIILTSHFGRPKGKVVPELSLKQIIPEVTSLFKKEVIFAEDLTQAKSLATSLKENQILLIENLRFWPEEEKNDANFAASLANLADIYVNDAFSCSHRKHASIYAISTLLPSALGLLFEEEINSLSRLIANPKKPYLGIIGGAKISTKMSLIRALLKKLDMIFIGGAMANTFLKARGINVGESLIEEDYLEAAREIEQEAKNLGCELVLPIDAVVAKTLEEMAPNRVVSLDKIENNDKIFDVGPETIKLMQEKAKTAKTVIWNGPLGVIEIKPFNNATTSLMRFITDLTEKGELSSFAGGGDTIAAIKLAGVFDKFSYVSTAGGAFLAWLENNIIPGLENLQK